MEMSQGLEISGILRVEISKFPKHGTILARNVFRRGSAAAALAHKMIVSWFHRSTDFGDHLGMIFVPFRLHFGDILAPF